MEGSGLRERKKIRTRATLVDAAAELCLKQGYDNTTVEQIAAVADVSPRMGVAPNDPAIRLVIDVCRRSTPRKRMKPIATTFH